MDQFKQALKAHTVKKLKEEASKYNKSLGIITGYSKMSKDQLIEEMSKHKDKFMHLMNVPKKEASKPAPKASKPAPKKEMPKMEMPKKEMPKMKMPKKEMPKMETPKMETPVKESLQIQKAAEPKKINNNMSAEMLENYKILGVEPTATLTQIKKAYKKMAFKYHPDRNKSESAVKKFQDISIAFTKIVNYLTGDDKMMDEEQEIRNVLKFLVNFLAVIDNVEQPGKEEEQKSKKYNDFLIKSLKKMNELKVKYSNNKVIMDKINLINNRYGNIFVRFDEKTILRGLQVHINDIRATKSIKSLEKLIKRYNKYSLKPLLEEYKNNKNITDKIEEVQDEYEKKERELTSIEKETKKKNRA